MNTKLLINLVAFLFFTGEIYSQNESKIIPYRKGHLWGYADTSGRIVVPTIYDSVQFEFGYNDNAIVYKNGKLGLVSPEGNLLLPTSWDEISGNYNDVAIVRKGNLFGAYAKKANSINMINIIPIKYTELSQPNYYYLAGKDKQNKVYNFDLLGHPITNEQIEAYNATTVYAVDGAVGNVECFNRYIIDTLRINHWKGAVITRKKFNSHDCRNFSLIIDTVPPIYDRIDFSSVHLNILFTKKNNRWGAINLSNKVIVPEKYDTIESCYPNFIVKENNKYGFLDKEGKILLASEFDKIVNTIYCTLVYKDNKVGLIDTSFTILPKYKNYNTTHKIKGYYLHEMTTADGQIGLVDNYGREYFE